jgi:DNA-binding CsgD family transcriptional regulator
VQITEAEKGSERAWELSTELVSSTPAMKELLIAQPAAGAWLIRLALQCGERDWAKKIVRICVQLAADNSQFASVVAASSHCIGLANEDLGQLKAAAGMHQDIWSRASALEDLAVIMGRRSLDQRGTVQIFKQAAENYLRSGSLRDLSRIRSRLRSLGEKDNPRDTGRRASGIPSLTRTEYAIAQLVAQGFTNCQTGNQLFLSRHTIAFHLRKIFRKLDVDSRVQLARVWSSVDMTERVEALIPEQQKRGSLVDPSL